MLTNQFFSNFKKPVQFYKLNRIINLNHQQFYNKRRIAMKNSRFIHLSIQLRNGSIPNDSKSSQLRSSHNRSQSTINIIPPMSAQIQKLGFFDHGESTDVSPHDVIGSNLQAKMNQAIPKIKNDRPLKYRCMKDKIYLSTLQVSKNEQQRLIQSQHRRQMKARFQLKQTQINLFLIKQKKNLTQETISIYDPKKANYLSPLSLSPVRKYVFKDPSFLCPYYSFIKDSINESETPEKIQKCVFSSHYQSLDTNDVQSDQSYKLKYKNRSFKSSFFLHRLQTNINQKQVTQ